MLPIRPTACSRVLRSTRRTTRLLAALALVLVTIGAVHADDADSESAVSAVGSGAPPIVPAFRMANRLGVLTIEGPIDAVTARSIERRLARATEDGCDAIVFEINTPGGEQGAMLDICAMVRDPSRVRGPSVAWINHNAYSAGTVIALACDEIVVAPNATFGDAAPIAIGLGGLQQLAPTERAKIVAPIRTEVVGSARRNHYDEKLVQSFIEIGTSLWMLEHRTTGARIFVDAEEYRRIFGEEPETSIPPTTPAAADTDAIHPMIQPFFKDIPDRAAIEGDGLSAEDLKQRSLREVDLPSSRPLLGADDADEWTVLGQVVGPDELLTIQAPEAVHYGLAADVISSDLELLAHFGAADLIRYDRTWSESLVRFLIQPAVRMILIVIFILFAVIEMFVPGSTIFGAVSVCALLLLVGAPALAGFAQWWDLALLGVGLLLVLAEIFVIPGFGVAGIAGAIAILIGLIGTFISGDLSSPEGQSQLWTGVGTIVTAFFVCGVGFWFLSRHFHNLPLLDRLVLRAELRTAGVDGQTDVLTAMGTTTSTGPEVDDRGTAATDLRPTGRVMIDDVMYDAHAPGRYIDAGRPIRVVAVGRFEIEVEECTE